MCAQPNVSLGILTMCSSRLLVFSALFCHRMHDIVIFFVLFLTHVCTEWANAKRPAFISCHPGFDLRLRFGRVKGCWLSNHTCVNGNHWIAFCFCLFRLLLRHSVSLFFCVFLCAFLFPCSREFESVTVRFLLLPPLYDDENDDESRKRDV